MRYFEMAPTAPLANFVQCFWYLEKDYGRPHQEGEWIFPDGTTDFVLQRRGQFRTGVAILPTGFLVGPRRKPLLLRNHGRAAAVGVRFHASGLYPIFRQPLETFDEKIVPISVLVGPHDGDLTEQIVSQTPLAALVILERFLLGRLPVDQNENLRMQSCIHWLKQTMGAAPISELAAHANLSSRQLERRFRLTTGFSPKQLARIYRFDAVRDRLMLQPDADLTALAHAARYHDQAHFIHDFRDLAGLPPTGFVREVVGGTIRFNG